MIWYDVTDVMGWQRPHLTGIQRTTVGILAGLRQAGADVGLVRHDRRAGRFRIVAPAELPPTIRSHLAGSTEDPCPAGDEAAGTDRRRAGGDARIGPWRKVAHSLRRSARRMRESVARRSVRSRGWSRVVWQATPLGSGLVRDRPSQVDASAAASAFAAPGDILLSVGATWCMPGHGDALGVLRSRGVWVARMIYDLIPMLKPQWVERPVARQFTCWARQLLAESDVVLTISEYTRGEIDAYCDQARLRAVPVHVVRLGDVVAPAAAAGRVARPRFVPARPFFLCVSTLDVRKNHRLLYDAWTHLVARRGNECPDLVCVGTPHLYVTDLLHEIREDWSVNRHIHMLDGVTDAELGWYYATCAATIYPSKYEGWGLPVAESLGQGRICLASNATSIPEISDLPEFFDPHDVRGLVTLVDRVLDEPDWVRDRERAIRAGFRPTEWRTTAAEVLAAIEGVIAAPRLVLHAADAPAAIVPTTSSGRQARGMKRAA